MLRIERRNVPGYEQLAIGRDDACGLHAAIAVHSTALGPSLGGVRMAPYADEAAALHDVLRLSHAMSRKNAISGLALGGGKSVILGDPHTQKTPALVEAMGEFIEALGGAYIGAEDAGMTPRDMDTIASRTRHVTGTTDGSGAPGLSTAPGVMIGIERAARDVLGARGDDVNGLTVAVQGLGSVGWMLCDLLYERGAKLIVTDVRRSLMDKAVEWYGADTTTPDRIHAAECDVFAPCALGGVLNERTIGELRCRVVAGGANNQFADQRAHPALLMARGIEHAPDYVINAGGVIRIFVLDVEGKGQAELDAALHRIGDQLTEVWHRSREERRPPLLVADEIADARIAGAAA